MTPLLMSKNSKGMLAITAQARKQAIEQAEKKLKVIPGNPADSVKAVRDVLKEQTGRICRLGFRDKEILYD